MNRKSFIAKARSSTKSCESSGTYGIYVGEHRDDTDFFPKDGKTVTLRLLVEGEDPRIMEDVTRRARSKPWTAPSRACP